MKRILIIAFVLAFLVGFFPASTASAGDGFQYPLMAGQTTQVGWIYGSDDGTNLTVRYEITEPGWFLVATHLYVGTTAPKNGAPGLFPYGHTALHTTIDTYDLPIAVGTQYYLAAHAVVANEENIVGWDCPMTLDDINAALPDAGTAMATYIYPHDSYFDLVVSSNSGFLNGTYRGWCLDYTHGIYVDTIYPANFFSSYESLPDYLITGTNPNIDKEENLDLVNWVINQNFTPAIEVQNAIWFLIEDSPPACNTTCMDIVNQALTHNNFVPNLAAGEKVAVIVARVPDAEPFQASFLELGVECTPIYQEETAWASAGGKAIPFKTGWGSYFIYTP